MLTAAHDIISDLAEHEASSSEGDVHSHGIGERPCNLLSTGAVLLADVIPGLVIKLLSLFLPFWAKTLVSISCLLAVFGFISVALAESQWLALCGVALTSLASGLGEPAFLAYTAFFNKNVISTWSSGTGAAGIFGALAYSILRGIGFTNRQTMMTMIGVPIFEILVLFFLLRKPASNRIEDQDIGEDVIEDAPPLKSIKEKVIYIQTLFHYMIPLGLVYFFEYFINQGFFELVYFPNIFLDDSEQYRYYQVIYQVGVFVSRSSVNIVQVKHIWIMAVLQGLNVIFFFFEAVFMFTPSIWIIFSLIFFEGLLGGGTYVNTFYKMSKEVPANRREYAMSVVTLSDYIGITAAGFLAMPVHNVLCGLPGGIRLQ